jgi:hypothetical protein
MRPQSILFFACLCALVGALTGAADLRAESEQPAPEPTIGPTADQVHRIVDVYRRRAWHWQRVMGRPLTRALQMSSTDPAEQVGAWRRIAVKSRWLAQHPPHRRAWLCIHRYEGRWEDPNPPYYGGLQMDVVFQQRYGRGLLGRKGTADHWTPLEQMWTAERAHRSGRGFWPWPNTARYCGLV